MRRAPVLIACLPRSAMTIIIIRIVCRLSLTHRGLISQCPPPPQCRGLFMTTPPTASPTPLSHPFSSITDRFSPPLLLLLVLILIIITPPSRPTVRPPPTPLTFPLRDSEGSLRAEVRHGHRQHHRHPAVWPHRRRVPSDNSIRATQQPRVGVVLSPPVLPPRSAPSPGSRRLSPSPLNHHHHHRYTPLLPIIKERLLSFLVVLSPQPLL